MRKGTCKHFTGLYNSPCKAGVDLRKHVGGSELGWGCRIPCTTAESNSYIKPDQVVPCDHFAEPTPEEIRKSEEEIAILIARMEQVSAFICELKAEHQDGWYGQVECPICKGVLEVEIAAYNLHAHVQCRTNGCVNIME